MLRVHRKAILHLLINIKVYYTSGTFMSFSEKVVAGLEDFFGWYGRKVAAHPLPVIVFCLVATGLSAIGVLRYRYSINRTQNPLSRS
jgi:hypothetical protein